jgi:hypothetical protein
MIERQTELGRCYGMEINVGKIKAMRISSQPSPAQIRKIKKQPENLECFNYLSS